MGEKRGKTGKLVYEFNTAAHLEVQLKGNWYRVTAGDFRSFNGPRRIFGEPYEGQLYFYDTNTIVEGPQEHGIVYLNGINARTKYSKREGER